MPRPAAPRRKRRATPAQQLADDLDPRPQRRGQARLDATADGPVPTRGTGVVDQRADDGRLADARLPVDERQLRRSDVGPLQRRRQRGPLRLATHEQRCCRLDRHGSLGGGRRSGRHSRRAEVERGILGEDPRLEVAQLRPGVETELVEQRVARRSKGAQRLGLTTAAVQRQREQRPTPFAQRLGVDRLLQRGHGLRGAPDGEQGLEALLDRRVVLLGDPHRELGDGLVRPDAGQRRTAPQRERLVEQADRRRRVGRSGLADEGAEAVQVDLLGRQPEDVAGRLRHQHGRRLPVPASRLERPAEPGHVALQRAEGRPRRRVTPQPVDEPIDRDDAAELQGEVGDDGALLRATELQWTAVVEHLDGSEQLHPEHSVSYHDLSGAVLAMATSARPTTLRRSSALRSPGCGCRRSSMRRAPRPPRRWRRTAPRRPAPATARSRGPSP